MEPSKNNRLSDDRQIDRVDLELLALAKRTGLSFAEINEMRAIDLLAYARAYARAQKDEPRAATQEDIDRLLA